MSLGPGVAHASAAVAPAGPGPLPPSPLGPGTYNVTFAAPQLNATVSYSFTVDGVAHTQVGGQGLVVPLSPGLHWVTNLTAYPAAPGWRYFGRIDSGNPIAIAETASENLSYAYENLTAPPITVAFTAQHLPSGVTWRLGFNGTVYPVPGTTLNLTVRPGAYVVFPFNTANSLGTALFTVPASQGSLAWVARTSVVFNYTAEFFVQVLATVGGTVNLTLNSSCVAAGSPVAPPWAPFGACATFRALANPGYQFVTWVGTGVNGYTGPGPRHSLTVAGPVTELASFTPRGGNYASLHVNVFTLPNGTLWTVFVNGQGYTSGRTTLTVPSLYPCPTSGPPTTGLYNLSVPYAYANVTEPWQATRFLPGPYPAQVCGNATVDLNYTAQYLFSLGPFAGGTVTGTVNGTPYPGPEWLTPGAVVDLTASPAAGFQFAGWSGEGVGSYSGSSSQIVLTVGGPVYEVPRFTGLSTPGSPRYVLTLEEDQVLAPGTVWTVTVNGTDHSSADSTLVLPPLAPGTYPASVETAISPDGLSRFVPTAPLPTWNVTGNATIPVGFSTEFWVGVTAAGPGAVSFASQWVAAGSEVSLMALPDPGAQFLGWVGGSPAAYSGSGTTMTISVTGPVLETAAFTQPSSNAFDPGRDPLALGAIAAAAGITGLLFGLWWHGRGRRPTTAPVSSFSAPAGRAPPPEGGVP